MTVTIPHLERLSKEGEQGRKKITQYTRYGTILLSVIQGFGISVGLEKMMSPGGAAVVIDPGWGFRIMTVMTLTAGTAFIMWLGEQITERGIGNGISLIIFAGIIARLPAAVGNTFRLLSTGEMGTICHNNFSYSDGTCCGLYPICGNGSATDNSSICQKGCRPQNVWRPEHPFTVKGQYLRRDTTDIRFINHHVPGNLGQFYCNSVDTEHCIGYETG